ncbi:MAG TPA: YgaP-like transmembrane domain [Stellaceae bacterium]|nr:YgaP-like transmembrane domain [Stellaceae bacterium]
MADTAAPLSWRNVSDGERVVSGIGGALLLGYGLARRPSLASALMAAAGAWFVTRGAGGHCALYQALGIDTSGRAHRLEERHSSLRDAIEHASDASFPASDPPPWSPGTAGHHAR